MKTQLIPRSAYMAREVTHDEYYDQYVTPGIREMVRRTIGEKTIKDSRDPHFNDIELKRWDYFGQYGQFSALRPIAREAGETLSLSFFVCVAKAAARQIKGGIQ